MATSTHNKYVSIPDWFSSSSSTPITSAEKPANITNVYYGGGSGGGTTEIPIDNKTIVWLDLVITVPIDNDKIIINTEGKITTSGTTGVWELRQLTDGTNYIYTTYPVVTQLGITMYAGTDGLNLGSIYDGLPIDNATIYWDLDENGNKILKAVGSSGGVADSVAWANVTGKPNWLLDGKILYTEIEGIPDLSGFITKDYTDGKFVTFDLNETINGIKTFTNGIKIGTSLINQSLNDVIYIDANLAVRGGITMYATGTVDIPSILDSLPVAGTESKGIASFDSSYFSVTNGKVTLLADNVGLNESELAEYLNTNNYAKKSDIPSLNGYATQSWVESKGYALNSDLMSLTTKVDDFLEGSDTDTIINKWLELEAFLSGLSESDNLATILGNKADKSVKISAGTGLSGGGTLEADRTLSLATSGVTAGTYKSVTVDKYGRVTGGTNPTTLAGYGITDAYTKTKVDELLGNYVTLATKQTITGEKNFTGGLKINGSPIVYDATNKYWKLEGDLLVTGGVTMYGSDSSFTPSTIMDAIAVDGTTISKDGGVLKVIGGTGGGVADSVAWANITGKPTWIGSSKPSYSYSEITGAISTTELQNYLTSNSYLNVTEGDNRYLKLSGGTLTGKTSISARLSLTNGTYLEFVDKNESIRLFGVYPNKNDLSYYDGAWNKVWHEGNFNPSNYLPLSGGTISGTYGALIIHRTNEKSSLIKYSNSSGDLGHLGFNSSKEPFVYKGTDTTTAYKLWHTGNDGSGSGLDADKLDGVQLNELFSSLSSDSTNKVSITIGGVTKNITTLYATYTNNFRVVWNNPTSGTYELNDLVGGFVRHYGSGGSLNNAPSSFGNGAVLALSNGTKGLCGQLAWNIVHNSTSNVTNKLWWRVADSTNGFTYSQWKQIAFTNSNVASATKLETARTIWGQSFDGTGNVDGNLKINVDVTAASAASSALQINNTGTYAGPRLINAYSPNLPVSSSAANGVHLMFGVTEASYNAAYMKFWYAGAGSTNNAIRFGFHTSDNLMSILANGNVGIGTTAPDYKFHVVGTSHINGEASFNSSVTLKGTGSTTARFIMSRNSYNYINYPADGSLCLGTSNASASTQLFINGATGNVGIGTVEPSAKFHVKGTSHLRGTVYVTNADATTMVEDSGKIKFNSLNTRDDLRSPYIQAIHQANYSRKRLSIFQSNATNYTDDFVEVFTILPNGNVGIGTTSPTSKCDIYGLLTIRTESSTSQQSSLNLMNTSSDLWQLSARYGSSEGGNFNIYYYNGSTWAKPISINKNGNLLATGGITMYSDQRKKTILNHVELSLKDIANAPLIEHYYNSDENKTTHVGSIAQYWANMNDWFCKLDSEGFYTMEIQNAALASAISIARELDRYETKTDKAIKKLKKRICELEEEVERLKAS